MGWSWLVLLLRSALVILEMGRKLPPGKCLTPGEHTVDGCRSGLFAAFSVYTQDTNLILRFTLEVSAGMAAFSCSWVMREPCVAH